MGPQEQRQRLKTLGMSHRMGAHSLEKGQIDLFPTEIFASCIKREKAKGRVKFGHEEVGDEYNRRLRLYIN